MAKHRHHRKSRRHHHTRRRHRGGTPYSAPSPTSYSSGSSFGMAVNGTEDAQYGRVFNQSSPYPPNGNAIIGAQGQRAGSRRRRHGRRRHSRKHRGGFMGVLNRALAPIALIGMQQAFAKRTRRHHK